MSKASFVPSDLQVDYDKNITSLYQAITESNWEKAISACKKNPDEAKTWVVRHYENEGHKADTEIMWRFLPIHSACARQPPAALITALLEAYPEGSKCVDDQGMYALHYACGNQATREVIRLLLMSFPEAAKIKDPRGMLPIHYIACWGPSSISVVDMVLVANRDVADVKDEDGNTAIDLAREGEYPERDAVVAALKRWLDNGGSSASRKSSSVSGKPSILKSISHDEKKEEVASPRTVGRLRKEVTDLREGRSNMDADWSKRFNVQEMAYTDRVRMLEAQIDSMMTESKYDKLNISELQTKLAIKDAELDSKTKQLKKASEERDGLRQTLADLTEQHDKFKNKSEILTDRLGSMNASLLTMMEQQEIVTAAMKSREEQWQSLSDMRREKLKELVAIEEQDTCEEVELRGCLMKQTKEMEAIKAVIAAVRQQDRL
mmetsp:Transcript_62921/g.153194  ORF Transcript_62921/g.153194 Transcript_62921/m.153194 type:complete len:435 (+) Transcript_62921:210-1514(+)